MTTHRQKVKKVAIIGPESTGKSELAAFLAERFNTVWVPEYAREYINNLDRPYEPQDLIHIAHGQLRLEDETLQKATHGLLICDTDLYVIKVWSLFKYGRVDPQILNLMQTRSYDLYLLTYFDIPWEEDPLREHPDKREELYELYHKEMLAQPVPFTIIKGEREQRRNTAVEAIEKLLAG